MEQYDQIGARLDRLPLARFHYRIFGIISFSLLLTGFLSYSGNVVLAKLVAMDGQIISSMPPLPRH
ncbi:metabolite transport protein [Escherichia coli]|nr:metabolite transport protein [Escherichia coli]